ncbi:MAG: flippase-like domain-containing protein [Gemmatimonadales bacterium]|nr:flippase-like domain-containing protein [Gemmatimonadales bacterium]
MLAVIAASIIAWRVASRCTSPATRQLRRPVLRARVYWRRMPWWPIAASVPMSLLNLGTRVAILPVLALTLPSPPPLGPTALGSFALLYSQLLLPTPSGAGAVELGFLGGAAGDLGAGQGWLLVAWRFYTNGIGLLLGMALAVHTFGWPAIRAAVRRLNRSDGESGTA